MKKPVNSLTITVGSPSGGVDAHALSKVLRNVIVTLEELDKQIGNSEQPSNKWMLTNASMKSPLTLTFAEERVFDDAAQVDVVGPFIRGLRCMHEQGVPQHFSDRAVDAVRSFTSVLKDGIPLSFSGNGDGEVEVTHEIATHATRLKRRNRKPYSAPTVLEGTLEKIDVHGKPEFSIYDRLTKEQIRCFFDETLAPDLGSLITQRIRVSGKTRFDADHRPISIRVDSFKEVTTNPPSMKDLQARQIDVTGGKDSVAHVRGLRNA